MMEICERFEPRSLLSELNSRDCVLSVRDEVVINYSDTLSPTDNVDNAK